jgi:hypothetical protein
VFLILLGRADLKSIGPVTPNWVPALRGPELELSTLDCSSTHNTLQVLQRTAIGSVPPKAGPASC